MWRVIVVEKTRTGKGRVAEYIGNYNPHSKPKIFNLDLEKYEKWTKNGAQPTDAVLRLKGKLIDKNKDYQKIVKAKVYKTKKTEEIKKEVPKVAKVEKTEEVKEEKVAEAVEAPIEEETVEEPKEEVKEKVKDSAE